MAIVVDQRWHEIAQTDDGNPIRAQAIFWKERIVGRVIDLTTGNYVAEFIDPDGEPVGILHGDYYSAILHVAENAEIRRRLLN